MDTSIHYFKGRDRSICLCNILPLLLYVYVQNVINVRSTWNRTWRNKWGAMLCCCCFFFIIMLNDDECPSQEFTPSLCLMMIHDFFFTNSIKVAFLTSTERKKYILKHDGASYTWIVVKGIAESNWLIM